MSSFDISAWMFLHVKHRFWRYVEFFVHATFSKTFASCTVNHVGCASQACIFILLDGKGHSNFFFYSLSRKTVYTRENFWNLYCFVTNQMRDKTVEGNRQTVAAVWHETTSCSFLLLVYKYWNRSFNFFLFQLMYQQIIDMNSILRRSDVESSRRDQTQLDNASESRNCTLLSIFISVSSMSWIIRVNISGIYLCFCSNKK